MLKNGQLMRRPHSPAADIEEVPYRPPSTQPLGVDTLNLEELRTRGSPAHLRAPQRMNFLSLMLYTKGTGFHEVDFERYAIACGSLIVVKPAQVHRFGLHPNLQGEILAVSPTFIKPTPKHPNLTQDLIHPLKPHQLLPEPARQEFINVCQALRNEANIKGAVEIKKTLAQYRLLGLLAFLQLTLAVDSPAVSAHRQNAHRQVLLQDFLALLERHFLTHWHVRQYAEKLGYAERTLNRVTLLYRGCTAKQLIDQRLILEFKRWLAHSPLSIAEISYRLGFNEASYAIQFFKRLEGQTPESFRKQQSASLA